MVVLQVTKTQPIFSHQLILFGDISKFDSLFWNVGHSWIPWSPRQIAQVGVYLTAVLCIFLGVSRLLSSLPLLSTYDLSSIKVNPAACPISCPVNFWSNHSLKLVNDMSCRSAVTSSPHGFFQGAGSLESAILTTVGELISLNYLLRLKVLMISLILPMYWSRFCESSILMFGNLGILS